MDLYDVLGWIIAVGVVVYVVGRLLIGLGWIIFHKLHGVQHDPMYVDARPPRRGRHRRRKTDYMARDLAPPSGRI